MLALRPVRLMKILVKRLSEESFRCRITLSGNSVGLCWQQKDMAFC